MTCGDRFNKNCPTRGSKVTPAEVDGRARCIHAHCGQRLRGDGTCPSGHSQTEREVGVQVFHAGQTVGQLLVVTVPTTLPDIAAAETARVRAWEQLAAQGEDAAVERVEPDWLEPLTVPVEIEEGFIGGAAHEDCAAQTFEEFCVARQRPDLIAVPHDASLLSPSGHVSKVAERRAKKRSEQELALWAADRALLLYEYQQLLAAGKVRQPTRAEKLIQTARGHPDRQDVQAARRLLQRQGIAWQEAAV